MEDYSVQCKLGDGAQGVVYKVQHTQTGQEYAMKVICCADQGQVNLALQEIKVLLQLRHPNIVSYVDFFLVFNSAKLWQEFEHVAVAAQQKDNPVDPLKGLSDIFQGSLAPSKHESLRVFNVNPSKIGADSPPSARNPSQAGMPAANLLSEGVRAHWLKEEEIAVCLVMELCRNGDMAGMIADTKRQLMATGKHPVPEAQVLSWMEQCAAALDFIHGKGFLHRDLKPTNVFYDDCREVKIGDFGLAATVGNGGGRKSAVGTPYYLAPERMVQQRYDGKVDVWGLGVIVLELVTLREQPVNSMVLENPAIVDSVVKSVTKMGFSTKLAALLRDMLQRKPEARPTPAVVLQRLNKMMTSGSPHLGMSASLFAGMSCPKLAEPLCDVCEVEPASVACAACRAHFCQGCDRARHKHVTRRSHERTPFCGGNCSSFQHQQTLSTSRTTSPGNLSEQRSFPLPNTTSSPTASSPGGGSRNLSQERSGAAHLLNSPQSAHPRAFSRLHNALGLPAGNSLSISEFSLSQSVMPPSAMRGDRGGSPIGFEAGSPFSGPMKGGGTNMSHADTLVRVPADFATLSEALAAVTRLQHIRKIVVAGNTTHSEPLTLTKALPESVKIVGESPSPVLEVADSSFALSCESGKGVVENFIIRHVGRANRRALADLTAKANTAAAGMQNRAVKEKRPPRPTAISITGGQWAIRKCRISCVDGSGVTVGAVPHGCKGGNRSSPIITNLDGSDDEVDDGSDDDGAGNGGAGVEKGVVDPVISKCFFMDVTTAGVVVQEKARGLYEGNTFSGCGYAAFLLKKESSARVRANRITDGAETGIFCQDAQGSIEYNLIAQNAGCGVVVKGAGTTAIFRKNRVLSNAQAGFFCCDRAAPFISDNEISHNHKAGVLIKSHASPKVSHNVIEGGKEAGVYVFENGGGIIEDNKIRGNQNAGLLVTTHGHPHVIHNSLSKNAYEGIWICKDGAGTFCDNDLRGNARGAMDIDQTCRVTWVGNTEK